MDMHSFQHNTPPLRLLYGPDSLGKIERELEHANSRRALIFCDPALTGEGAPLDLIQSNMGDRCVGVFSDVLPHSPLPSVEAGAQEIKRLKADALVVVGGGSTSVTARAANVLAFEKGDPRSLCTSRDERGNLKSPKLLAPKLPQLLFPTTPTTATAKVGAAFFDPVSGKRLALFDPKNRAHSIFILPELVMSAPRALAVNASLNTFAMAIEGLMSHSGDPLSDALLMQALRLLALHLPNKALHDDPHARGELMLASVLCGLGTDYTGVGITVVLGHSICAAHHLNNGDVNAIILPHSLRFNADAGRDGLVKVATSLGLPSHEGEALLSMVINAVEAILDQLEVPRRLRDVGVPREAFFNIATNSMDDWYLRFNARQVREASELQKVLEEAW